MTTRHDTSSGPLAPGLEMPGRRAWQPEFAAPGGVLGAIAAASCCVLPLVLFSLGISGAWMSNLVALEPYKPAFAAVTLGLLGYGYWMVYRKPWTCGTDRACASPARTRLVKSALWMSTVLVVVALFWNWIAPVVAPIMLGL